MIPYPKSDVVTTIEGVKERLSEPLDFNTVLLSKLAFALTSHKPSFRQAELNDIEDLLSPYHDDQFEREMKKLHGEKDTWNGANGHFDSAYLRGRLRIIMRLMKRNNLLPLGMI